MANITQYSGTFVEGNGGNHIVSWIGEEGCADDLATCRGTYLRIQAVSDSSAAFAATYNAADEDFDPAYDNTLYYIYDSP